MTSGRNSNLAVAEGKLYMLVYNILTDILFFHNFILDQFTSKESDLVYLYGTVGKIFIGLGYFEEVFHFSLSCFVI